MAVREASHEHSVTASRHPSVSPARRLGRSDDRHFPAVPRRIFERKRHRTRGDRRSAAGAFRHLVLGPWAYAGSRDSAEDAHRRRYRVFDRMSAAQASREAPELLRRLQYAARWPLQLHALQRLGGLAHGLCAVDQQRDPGSDTRSARGRPHRPRLAIPDHRRHGLRHRARELQRAQHQQPRGRRGLAGATLLARVRR